MNMTSRKNASQELKRWLGYGFSHRHEMKGPFAEKQTMEGKKKQTKKWR
jgi:hypothetical protein